MNVIHTCHWPGCQTAVSLSFWGCNKHWFAQLETIGAMVEKANNLIAASTLPIDPSTHIECLRFGLGEIRDALNQLYDDLGGESV